LNRPPTDLSSLLSGYAAMSPSALLVMQCEYALIVANEEALLKAEPAEFPARAEEKTGATCRGMLILIRDQRWHATRDTRPPSL
jgi:hypothetical protein